MKGGWDFTHRFPLLLLLQNDMTLPIQKSEPQTIGVLS
jgi:hypothetical protein